MNDAEFLKDPSGGRRFWPVHVDTVDIEALRRDRDQLWAEAVAAYRAGERYWPDTEEEHALCAVEQEERRVLDSWESIVAEFVADRDQVTIPEILETALEIKAAARKQSDSTRVGNILQALHWTMRGRRNDKGRTRFYVPTPKAVVTAAEPPKAKPGDANDTMIDPVYDLMNV